MPLVGASPVYRPPVAGEPLRLREDGHWSTDRLALCCYANQGNGYTVPDLARGHHHQHSTPNIMEWRVSTAGGRGRLGIYDNYNYNYNRRMRYDSPVCNFGDGSEGTIICWLHDTYINQIFWTFEGFYDFSFSRVNGFTFYFQKNNSTGYNRLVWAAAWQRETSRMATATWRPNPGGDGYEVTGYTNGAQVVQRTDIPNPLYVGAPPRSWIGAYGMTIMQWMVYERYLPPVEVAALYADPDLPIWRPRRGISLALVAVGGGAVPMIYRAARRRSRTLIPGMVVLP